MAAVGAPAWVRDYIGIPFRERGRTREGVDCWGLARLVWTERFGFTVPSLDGAYERLSERDRLADVSGAEKAAHWRAVPAGREQAGDCVLLSIMGRPIHVGVVVAPGLMLHAEVGVHSCIESTTSAKWGRRVLGFYRWNG